MKRSLVLTLFLSLVLSNVSFAKDKKGGKGMGMMQMLKELDLSKEQKEKMKALRSEAPKKSNRDEIKALKEQLQQKFASNAKDAELKALNDKIIDAESNQRKSMYERVLKIRSILTPEQRKKFLKLQNEKKQKMMKRFNG